MSIRWLIRSRLWHRCALALASCVAEREPAQGNTPVWSRARRFVAMAAAAVGEAAGSSACGRSGWERLGAEYGHGLRACCGTSSGCALGESPGAPTTAQRGALRRRLSTLLSINCSDADTIEAMPRVRRTGLWPLSLGLSFCVVLMISASSRAQPQPMATARGTTADKMTARELFFQGNAAMKRRDFAVAVTRYERSEKLYSAPTTRLALARALAANGELVRAFETYNASVLRGVADDASPAFKQAWQIAKRELTELKPRVPSLVIIVRGATQPTVSIDGSKLAAEALGVRRYVDPGKHLLRATAAGHQPIERVVHVSEGKSLRVVLELQPAPAATPLPSPKQTQPAPATTAVPDHANQRGMSPMRIAALTTGAVGVAGLIAFGVTGGLFLAKKSEALRDCTARSDGDTFDCQSQQGVDAAAAADSLATANTVLLFAGLAATGVGVTLWLLDGSSGGHARLSPLLGPGHAGISVRGRF